MTSSAAAGVPRSSYERVLRAAHELGLNPKMGHGDNFTCLCPAHDDTHRSLSVTWQKDGLTNVWCHASTSCQFAAIAEAFGLEQTDFFDNPMPERRGVVGRSTRQREDGKRRGKLGPLPKRLVSRPAADHTCQFVETDTYPYTTTDGEVVQEVVRKTCTTCSDKEFSQRFADPSGRWLWNKPDGFTPVLYRQPELVQAAQQGIPVWIPEGEKDVHTAESLGLVAGTNSGGAGSFPANCYQLFAGAEVNLVLDRDAAGWARGVTLHKGLTEAGARRVRIWLPAEQLDEKADLTDPIEAGLDLDELTEVSVENVTARHLAAVAGKLAASVPETVEEYEAQRAEAARFRADKRAAGTIERHDRYAERWVAESEIRVQKLTETVGQLRAAAAQAGMIGQRLFSRAGSELRRARRIALALHEQAGAPVPAALRDEAPTAAVGSRGELVADGIGIWDIWRGQETGPGTSDPVSTPRYVIRHGALVEAVTKTDQEGNTYETYKNVLGIDLRVVEEEKDEGEIVDPEDVQLRGRESRIQFEAMNPTPQPATTAYVMAYTDPTTGEEMRMRVPLGDFLGNARWLAALPGMPQYDSRPAGIGRVRDAVRAVGRAGTVVTVPRYQGTGWRQNKVTGQYFYIHAGGAITPAGNVPARVILTGPLTRYDLPDPTTSDQDLRAAWQQCCEPMMRMSGRLFTPLVGMVWRSVIGPNKMSPVLASDPGLFKTGCTALAMQFFGERWDRNHPSTTMTGGGDTDNAISIWFGKARDVMVWLDDFAPAKSLTDAQKSLHKSLRLGYNLEKRGRTRRTSDGEYETTTPPAPTGSIVATSEIAPDPADSGGQRGFTLPLTAGQVELDDVRRMDAADMRYGRALLMSSMLQWLSEDYAAKKAHWMEVQDAYWAPKYRAAGERERSAEAAAVAMTGWEMMTTFLLERGAITGEEHEQLMAQAVADVDEALSAAKDPEMPGTLGARVLQLLSHALTAGLCHVRDSRSGRRPVPDQMAAQLGWRENPRMADTWEPLGSEIGWVYIKDGERELRLEQLSLLAVLRTAASQLDLNVQLNESTVRNALDAAGVLAHSTEPHPITGQPVDRPSVVRYIQCEGRSRRVLGVDLDAVLNYGLPDSGNPEDEPPGNTDPDGPGPDSPDEPRGGGPGQQELPDVDSSRQIEILSESPTTIAAGPTTPPTDEDDMTRTYSDASGHTAATVMLPASVRHECVLCGQRVGVSFDGIPIHIPCWERSTAASRAAVIAQRATEPEPAGAPPPAVPTPSRAAAETPDVRENPGQYRASSAVLDSDGLWFGDGTHVDVEAIAHIGDLHEIAEQHHLGTKTPGRGFDQGGQIWVTSAAMDEFFDIHVEHGLKYDQLIEQTSGHRSIAEALGGGWQVSAGGKAGSWSPWMQVWREGQMRRTHVLLVDMVDPGREKILSDGPTAQVLAWRLEAYAQALNFPLLLSPGRTGLSLLIQSRWKDREQVLRSLQDPPEPATASNTERDLDWSREITADERGREFVHAFDRGGSYLGPAGGIVVGIGEAQHRTGGVEFDKKLPGYWLLDSVPESADWRAPHPLIPSAGVARIDNPIWVTTPTLELAYEMGYELEPTEAWVWTEHGRFLEPWYKRVRDARAQVIGHRDDPRYDTVYETLKNTYTDAIGWLAAEGRFGGNLGYLPHWRHHVLAKARANVIRRILQIGQTSNQWPVAVYTDTIVYLSDEVDPVTAWPGTNMQLGIDLGQYKPERSGLLTEHRKFLNGKRYAGKEQLTSYRQWAEEHQLELWTPGR